MCRTLSAVAALLLLVAACNREPRQQVQRGSVPAAQSPPDSAVVSEPGFVPVRGSWSLTGGDSLVMETRGCRYIDGQRRCAIAVLHAPSDHPFHACPSLIESPNPADTLALVEDTTITLDGFAIGAAPPVNLTGAFRGPLFSTVHDGAGEVWLCFKGAWAVTILD